VHPTKTVAAVAAAGNEPEVGGSPSTSGHRLFNASRSSVRSNYPGRWSRPIKLVSAAKLPESFVMF
jgi:hypothetical protein